MRIIHTYGFSDDTASELKRYVSDTIAEIRAFYAYDHPVTVLIFNAWTFYGVDSTGAYSYKDEVIEIHLDTTQDIESAKNNLRLTLYHEFAHIIRYHTDTFGDRVSDAVVLEGISAVIEEHLFETPFYVAPIENENTFFSKAGTIIFDTNFKYTDLFNGGAEFPNWFGYRLGYVLVKEFAVQTNLEYSKLVRCTSDEILRNSQLFAEPPHENASTRG